LRVGRLEKVYNKHGDAADLESDAHFLVDQRFRGTLFNLKD